MIKAIIFDMGGVLVKDPGDQRKKLFAKLLGVSVEEFESAYRQLIDDFQKGNISDMEFWEKIADILSIDKKKMPNLKDIWYDSLIPIFTEDKEVFEVVDELKRNKYLVALLSNTEKPTIKYVETLDYSMFDIKIYSCEIGMIKPDAEIYVYTLDKLGIKAEEAVLIDDKDINIDGAEELGMKTILFKNAKQMKKELLKLGVKAEVEGFL
ncbi:HAD family phosphatase [Candidatus Woesearchaeota archaeon]|jgi:epoxide hydrolase-like predicted phosphatase|nr:HAD family phosphatase [Candidatus Woesearchaeota archaeon]